MGGGGRFFRNKKHKEKQRERERIQAEEQQLAQNSLLSQRQAHEAEMTEIEKVLTGLREQGQNYSNIASQSQEVLRQNNQAVASAIQSRSEINLGQEDDSSMITDEKKKNKSKVGTGISRADML